jgi:hypothetical protein
MPKENVKISTVVRRLTDRRWKRVAVFTLGWAVVTAAYGIADGGRPLFLIALNITSYVILLSVYLLADVETCPRCGGRLRLLALVTQPKNVERFLRHLGEQTEPPPRAPARAPPFWHSPVLRRRHHRQSAETTQSGLFEEH